MAEAPASENLENNSNGDSEEEEIFEDAEDTVKTEGVDLEVSLCESKTALSLFLHNKFGEAVQRVAPWSNTSVYQSISHTTLLYLQAVLSFDKPDIDLAIASAKRTIQLADSLRHKTSVLQTLKQISRKADYSSYTDLEVHAELVFAESLLLRAVLSFVQDENLISFLKGALKIKTCYQSYKECLKILEQRDRSNLVGYEDFASGVEMGIGAFNLLISQLPTRVLRLLEFVGFSGNKSLGLRELKKSSSKMDSLRGPLSSLILLAYNTEITYILGTADGDTSTSEEIVKRCLIAFPENALFLFFRGRVEQIKGNVDVGIDGLLMSVDCQSEWTQFHHICFWELMWSYAYKCDWLMAMKYAERLADENKWSKATYLYLKASFLTLCDNSESTAALVTELYNQVPDLIQRFAGKSLPIEKFTMKKVKLYKAQDNQLFLAALEMIYVWNGFAIIGRSKALLEPMMKAVEDAINSLLPRKQEMQYFHDNYSLALLLKGVCLSHSGQHFQADMCFQEILTHTKKLKIDTYLAPWAAVERGLLRIEMGELKEASDLLETAKNSYKGYALESRLHFKIHAANKTIQTRLTSSTNQDAASGAANGV